jgi:hypothetical protein
VAAENPAVLAGRAAIRGLRVSVAHVVNLVSNGMTPAQIVAELPDLEEDGPQPVDASPSQATTSLLGPNKMPPRTSVRHATKNALVTAVKLGITMQSTRPRFSGVGCDRRSLLSG